MNYRLNKGMIIVVSVLTLVAVGLFAYTLIRSSDTPSETMTETATSAPQAIDTTFNVKHQYANGIHTIAGTVRVPTPCHGVVVEPFFTNGSSTDAVELRGTTVREGEECPDVESDATFKVQFEAPEDAAITASWAGVPVRLNLVPAAPGESLDEEFYFKG